MDKNALNGHTLEGDVLDGDTFHRVHISRPHWVVRACGVSLLVVSPLFFTLSAPSAHAQSSPSVDISDPNVSVDLSVLNDGGIAPHVGAPLSMPSATPYGTQTGGLYRPPGKTPPVSMLYVKPSAKFKLPPQTKELAAQPHRVRQAALPRPTTLAPVADVPKGKGMEEAPDQVQKQGPPAEAAVAEVPVAEVPAPQTSAKRAPGTTATPPAAPVLAPLSAPKSPKSPDSLAQKTSAPQKVAPPKITPPKITKAAPPPAVETALIPETASDPAPTVAIVQEEPAPKAAEPVRAPAQSPPTPPSSPSLGHVEKTARVEPPALTPPPRAPAPPPPAPRISTPQKAPALEKTGSSVRVNLPPAVKPSSVASLSAPELTSPDGIPTPPTTSALGNTFRIIFERKSSKLPTTARSDLKAISTRMGQKEGLRLELVAYAGSPDMSASAARRLSLSRALAVRSFLIENGVRSTRIDVRALGNKSSKGVTERVDITVVTR